MGLRGKTLAAFFAPGLLAVGGFFALQHSGSGGRPAPEVAPVVNAPGALLQGLDNICTPGTCAPDAGARDGGTQDGGSQNGEGELSEVIVSIGFDDGFASQVHFLDMIEDLGLSDVKATFYINSSRLNLESNERQPRDPVRYAPLDVWYRAQRAGHEIGSHSVSHFDLSCTAGRHADGECQTGHVPLSEDERRRQVCTDRQMLGSLGFDVRGFAYPFGRDRATPEDASLHDLAARCGFEYARRANGLARGLGGGGLLELAESIPPQNPYGIRSYGSVTRDVGFAEMRRWILDAAANGGGWVPLIFHHISDDCSVVGQGDQELGVCVIQSELEALLRWLGRTDPWERAPDVVQVHTMGDVMRSLGAAGTALVANAGLEQAHSGSISRPNCFDRFSGKHETNFEWSNQELERQRQNAGQFGDPVGVNGSFEKLIPTPRYPSPMMRMTTRDDNCYLPVGAGAQHQVRLRARARSSDGEVVTGRFVFRRLSVSAAGPLVDPVWSDWPVEAPAQTLTSGWRQYSFDVPELPPDTVALAFGYQYVGPPPQPDAEHEIWLDDFSVAQHTGQTAGEE